MTCCTITLYTTISYGKKSINQSNGGSIPMTMILPLPPLAGLLNTTAISETYFLSVPYSSFDCFIQWDTRHLYLPINCCKRTHNVPRVQYNYYNTHRLTANGAFLLHLPLRQQVLDTFSIGIDPLIVVYQRLVCTP